MIPNKEIILTKADKLILQAMRTVVHGLGVYLGEGCEIILHSLEDLEAAGMAAKAAAIMNFPGLSGTNGRFI